jgi:hypothetical protein
LRILVAAVHPDEFGASSIFPMNVSPGTFEIASAIFLKGL